MATKLKPVDIAIVGLGWAGGIVAKELASTGLKIVAFERGAPRATNPDFMAPQVHDELRYSRRHELIQNLRKETLTFRNDPSQRALPMRQLGSFLPGEGVGGAGTHWSGLHWRWTEWEHKMYSGTVAKYGKSIVPADMNLQDWPIDYHELEPYYDKFEKVCGTSGKAGNLQGKRIDGGNIFEAPRANEFPNPPLTQSHNMVLFEQAARNLGYHPFPVPASNASRPYVNPDGVALGQCHYCGFCTAYGCEANAKASPHFTVIPLAHKNPNFEARTNSYVMKVNLDSRRKRAVSVTYLDAGGREFEQPADLVILAAYVFGNVHLMLHSKIGKPFDFQRNSGVVGRSYAYQSMGGVAALFSKDTYFNPFMGSGALGTWIDDFNSDNPDFAKLGFIGGGGISSGSNSGAPIGRRPTPPGSPRWGKGWKKAVVETYHRMTAVGNQGSVMSYRQNYLDLDPTYTDSFGRPMLRLTFDWQENEFRQMEFARGICANIAKEMGAEQVLSRRDRGRYSIVPYQTTHNTGGTVFGDDPRTSALNKHLQSWDVSNVFVVGSSVFPQNAGRNPTGPIGALAYRLADTLKDRYLKRPERLVSA
ncbi:GMC family oxidoreductase [Steroidobacter agaridevorans]|uniref:GMC family oxidoreductase n=1 Tax=Steroidobacter agaridevorans TaxID=2695856 RepID=A0A829YBY5_9GAMM|nr:GMC family oxidoreductase [Steroidobacter agaridevorans]GFE80112.1 GMC family oxidoreductase [Steroidobacter agaridevorans]